MPVLSTGNQTRKAAPVQRVYVRQRWTDAWTAVDYLWCQEVKFCLAPDIPVGTFEWRYGRGLQHDRQAFATFSPSDYLGWYVKVEIDVIEDLADPDEVTTLEPWYGIFEEVDNHRRGALTVGGARVLTGAQTLIAFGLEVLLKTTFVRASWYEGAAGEVKINRGLTTNSENTRGNTGNRTPGLGARNVPLFASDLSTSLRWSSRDLVEYLLAYHRPTDADGIVRVPFVAGTTIGVTVPGWDAPVKELHGRDVYGLLSEIMDRGRLTGWYAEVDETPETDVVRIQAVGFNKDNLTLPGGGIQLGVGASNEYTLDFDFSLDVVAAPLKESAVHNVVQVQVVGARVRSCFSLAPADGTLVSDWTIAQASAYNEAASQTAGYGALDRTAQEELNVNARAKDSVRRVYSHFKLPEEWDGRVGNGCGGALHPFLPASVGNEGPETFYRPELRFLQQLPFQDPDAVTAKEYLRPIALIKLEGTAGESGCYAGGRYQHLELVSVGSQIEGAGDGAGLRWSGHVRMQDEQAGVVISISGAPQHVIASVDFEPLPADLDRPAELNWRDNLVVTVQMECDRHVTEKWPNVPGLHDVHRVVVIDLGERARLDYVCPGTVTGIDARGRMVHYGAGAFVRDDRTRMQDLAKLAFAWYSQPRKAFRFELSQVFDGLALGNMITQIGSGVTLEDVNAVVTGIAWNLVDGRTEITTDFADLDFRALF